MIMNLPDADIGADVWAGAEPFPHVVVPDFLTPEDAKACGAEFPPPDGPWHTFTGPLEEGKQEGSADIAGPNVAALHAELASDEFVTWLRLVSGIPDLVADPHRHGGGIHQSGPGARLGLHTDFSVHPTLPLARAVNVIVFVGDIVGWNYNWGGMLELGADSDIAVRPDAGLMVAFESSARGYHGHPMPMSDDSPLRKSVPAYYYRPIRDGEDIEVHSTRFLER